MNSELPGECRGTNCGFGAFDEDGLGCDTGSGSCWSALMVEAEETSFHDAELQAATRKIQSILDGIGPDKKGRQLSWVHTEDGTLLAWVDHQHPVPGHAVRFQHGKDKVRRALKLRPRASK